MHIRVSRLKKCAHDRDSGYHPQSGYDNETAPSDDQHHVRGQMRQVICQHRARFPPHRRHMDGVGLVGDGLYGGL